MSSTVTPSAPKPVEANRPAQSGARAQGARTEGGDIFASLLSLLASTQVVPEASSTALASATTPRGDNPDDQDGRDNPITGLFGWGLSAAADAALDATGSSAGARGRLGLAGSAGPADPAGADGGIDISGMTAVEPGALDAAPTTAAALPANAQRPGAAHLPTVRAPDAMAHSQAGAWRHTPGASTETVALQHTAQAAAQVRSTVALNERFGLAPGVPLAGSATREATDVSALVAAPGSAARWGDAATAMPGAGSADGTAGVAGAAGSDTGGSDAGAFDQTDGQPAHPFAEASPGEEPVVTHWGTQHLRHASLRVGGEAGEQAIDIQLSMKGQEVEVAFSTDSAEARASLREHAGESLAELLGRSGMQLGGVSVGSQDRQGSRGEDGSPRQNGLRGVAQVPSASAQASARPNPISPRADGSQPLDVFA